MKNTFSYAIMLILCLMSMKSNGQTTIASEGLNNSSTLFTVSSGTYYSGSSGTGDRPASSAFAIESTHAYGISNGTATLTSSNISTSGYTSISLSFRLASFSIGSTGNGADGTDIVTVEVSPDGGTTYYSTVRVLGNTNAFWAYSTGTGNASTAYDGNVSPVDFTPAAGGNRTTDGYSTVTVSSIPSVANLRVRITAVNNSANERWVIDDFILSGTASSSVSDPTGVSATTVSTTQINLSATANGNNNDILVAFNTSNSFGTPTNGNSYSVSDAIAGGGTVIYKGAAGSNFYSHSSLTANTQYFYKVWSVDGSNDYSTGVTANATTAKIEPTNQPTNFTNGTITGSNIPLTWTAAAAGSQAPDGYIVKLSTTSLAAIADPSDGTDPSNDTDISDGSAQVKTSGTSYSSFTGFTSGTTYYFKIYAYTNSGTLINFNTTSPPTLTAATLSDYFDIASLGVAATENFSSLGTSSSATLPTGFVVSSGSVYTGGTSVVTQAYGSSGTGIVTGSSSGGSVNWANGVTGSSTERALGFLSTGSFTSPRSIMLKTKNNTGATINSVLVSFDYEKYRSGSRAFDWTFFYSTDGSNWTSATSGDQSYSADANNTTISDPPSATSKSFSITGLSIANGSELYFRWTYTGNGGSTNAQGLAIDNLSIVPFDNTNTSSGTVNGSVTSLNITSGTTTLTGNTTVTNGVNLASGITLDLAGNTLTINGTIYGSGTITGSSTSSLTLGGTAGTVNFTSGSRILKNLTLSAGATGTLGTALDITAGNDFGTVTIGNGATLTTGGNLTLKSDANGTAMLAEIPVDGSFNALGTISGNVKVERYYPSKRAWRLMAAPLNSTGSVYSLWQNGGDNTAGLGTLITGPGANPGTNGLDISPQGTATLYSFNQAGNTWSAITNTLTTNVSDHSAYLIFIRGDRNAANLNTGTSSITTLHSTGTVKTGKQNLTTNSNADGYALFGNPYPSPIDFNTAFVDTDNAGALGTSNNTNLQRKFYVLDPTLGDRGVYVTVSDDNNDGTYDVSNGSSAQTKHIQSGQGFFVQTRSSGLGTAQFTIKESHKSTTNNNNVFRPGSQREKISLILNRVNTDGSLLTTDGALAIFDNGLSYATDGADADKFSNMDENLSFRQNNNLLCIQGMPLADVNDTVFINIAGMKLRNYQLTVQPSDFNAPGLTAYLEDAFTGTATQLSLSAVTTVQFSVTSNTATSAANRFRIVFKNNTPLPLSAINVKAFEKNNAIQVEWNIASESGVNRYEVEESTDAVNFTKAKSQLPKANNHSTVNYAWMDNNITNGANYYRIKSIGNNGEIKLSAIVKVNVGKGQTGISIYPNPVSGGMFSLQMSDMKAGNYTLEIYNNAGQKMMTRSFLHAGGSATQSFAIEKRMPPGVYQLVIRNGNDRQVQTIIIND